RPLLHVVLLIELDKMCAGPYQGGIEHPLSRHVQPTAGIAGRSNQGLLTLFRQQPVQVNLGGVWMRRLVEHGHAAPTGRQVAAFALPGSRASSMASLPFHLGLTRSL